MGLGSRDVVAVDAAGYVDIKAEIGGIDGLAGVTLDGGNIISIHSAGAINIAHECAHRNGNVPDVCSIIHAAKSDGDGLGVGYAGEINEHLITANNEGGNGSGPRGNGDVGNVSDRTGEGDNYLMLI